MPPCAGSVAMIIDVASALVLTGILASGLMIVGIFTDRPRAVVVGCALALVYAVGVYVVYQR